MRNLGTLKVTIDRDDRRIVVNDLEKIEKININGSDYLVFKNCNVVEEGYIADLNKGEKVLTAEEANELKQINSCVFENLFDLANNSYDDNVKLKANLALLEYLNS